MNEETYGIDRARLAAAVREILQSLGEQPDDEQSCETIDGAAPAQEEAPDSVSENPEKHRTGNDE